MAKIKPLIPDHISFKLNGEEVAKIIEQAGLIPKGYTASGDVNEYTWIDCYREKDKTS